MKLTRGSMRSSRFSGSRERASAARRPGRDESARRGVAQLALLFTTAGTIGVAVPPVPAVAQDTEEILSYDVRIEIPNGAAMVVTEEIRVRALGAEIRRGIYRDFPTSFPRSSGLGRIEAPFQVLRVLQNGQPARYELLSIGGEFGRGGIQVRIGDPDVFLEPGEYTYTIEYETERWVTFGEASDQLYWNVTGNGWAFPILAASARVHVAGLELAPGLEAWTGPDGSTESHAEMSWDEAREEAVFRTTQALGAREGLTIRVTIPKGVLAPPSEEKQAEWLRLDWGGYIDAGYLVMFLIAMYALMWVSVGRDPAKRSTVVQYEPPEGFSPAALGYLQEQGYDDSQFAAALVSMAVKSAVRIEKDDWRWTLHKGPNARGLTPDEEKVFEGLLAGRSHLDLEQRHHRRIRKSIKSLKHKLSRQLEREYFVYNRKWFAAGLVVSILGFLILVWRARFGVSPGAWFLGLWLTGWTAGVATMIYRAFKELETGLRGGGVVALVGGAFVLLFSIPFVGAELFVSYMLLQMVPTHLMLAALAIGVVNVVFYHLLERPTLRGRGVLDHLDGFRTFLAATDEDRLDRMVEPERTPELFERFLPHAIALGLANRWAEGFQDVLTAEVVAARGSGALSWYQGSSDGFDASGFASSLGASLPHTLSSSSRAPGGSGGGSGGGGGGGGGSSGGGGGGGGGGGW